MTTALDRARAYLAKLRPAISGAGGHPATFRAACECVRFGLSDGDAMALLREFNRLCQPPWTEKELVHKLADARRAAGGQVRYFRQPAPAVRVVWKIERKAAVQAPAEPVKVRPPPKREPAEPLPEPSEPLTDVWLLRPGAPISAQFVDVLRTWAAVRQHPAWRCHPQIANA